ncbi:MAG: hypothetical protein AB7O43_12410 [Hyphomicrobiaceae bacterium]
MRRLSDVAIVLGVSAVVAFLIIAASNSLVARGTVWKSYAVWQNFVSRPDIVATSLLVIVVTMAVGAWQQRQVRR